jgi:hypothetical protein
MPSCHLNVSSSRGNHQKEKNSPSEKIFPARKKCNYFCFATAIASNPITDAMTATNGDTGACVVDGIVVGAVVVIIVVTAVTGAVVVTVVVKGTGAAFPRWDVVPVLKIVSVPNWFDTESRTS